VGLADELFHLFDAEIFEALFREDDRILAERKAVENIGALRRSVGLSLESGCALNGFHFRPGNSSAVLIGDGTIHKQWLQVASHLEFSQP
jgi:hypothetical protein